MGHENGAIFCWTYNQQKCSSSTLEEKFMSGSINYVPIWCTFLVLSYFSIFSDFERRLKLQSAIVGRRVACHSNLAGTLRLNEALSSDDEDENLRCDS